jgi:hypothetical protein
MPCGTVAALGAAEQEHRRHPERHRNDGRAVVALIAVLVQRQPGAGQVLVDEAGVGGEPVVACGACRIGGQCLQCRRHGRPGPAAVGVERVVAIAAAVRHPADAAAVGHRDRHAQAAGRHQVPQWRVLQHGVHGLQQRLGAAERKTRQQQRAGPQHLPFAHGRHIVEQRDRRAAHVAS